MVYLRRKYEMSSLLYGTFREPLTDRPAHHAVGAPSFGVFQSRSQVRLHVMRDQFDYFGRCLSLPTMFSSRIRLIPATVAGFAIRLWPAGTIFSDSAPSKWELL